MVELIVVIGILGILATVAITVVDPVKQFEKSNDARRKSDLKLIRDAIETYYTDHNTYPSGLGDLTSPSNYLDRVPKDPKDPSRVYRYEPDGGGQSYGLYASLEYDSDTSYCNGNSTTACTNAAGSCGTATDAICNYGVSSPNVSP